MMFQDRPGFARVASLAVAGVGCLALAACSTSGSTASTSGSTASASAAPSPSPTSTADPLASLTADQVAAKVIADAKAASSLTLVGTISDSGETINVNVAVKPGQGCTGTMALSGKGSFKLIVIGDTIYINPDSQFWKAFGGSQASTIIALVDGRWLKTTTSDKNVGSMTGICDVSQMFSTNGKQETLTKGTVTTLNGVRVLPLNAPDGSKAYVTDTSEPELVEIVAPKGSSQGTGKVTVTYDAPVTLAAPPASKVLDGSQLGF